LEDLPQQGRHAGGGFWGGGEWGAGQRGFGGAVPVGIAVFVQGVEPVEQEPGVGIGEVDLTEIPGGEAHADPLEVPVSGGDFEPPTFEADGAVAAALGARDLRGEGLLEG